MSYALLLAIRLAIALGDEQSIRILPSVSRVMKRHVGSTVWLITVRSRPRCSAMYAPVLHARAAERVGADPDAGAADGVEVEHVGRSLQ